MELPRLVVIKSNYNGKYLRYINEEGEAHGFLQFSGEEAISPLAKFELHPAKIGRKEFVHIRCCYNNKYWVSGDNFYIVAGATEPVEDQSKSSCTLFEPISIDSNAKTIRIRHVQLQHYACLWRAAAHPHDSCLCAASPEQDKDQCDVYTIIDWESLVILPKHIAFKGDNGNYLSACWMEGHPYLQFSASDIGDPTVGNEIFTTGNGSVRIKSDYHGKFWRSSPNGIWADSDDSSSNNFDILFWPVKVDNNVVALRSLGNNSFCKRLTTEGSAGCLNADVPTITREAHLWVEELVISRNIYNVDFRLMDARIYNQTVIILATANAINHSQAAVTFDLKLSHAKIKSSTWNNSISLKLVIETHLKSGIPLITADGKIEILDKFSGAYQWPGETVTSATQSEPVYEITVPPMTMATVSLSATKGFCDVPFSYSQRDTLTNGNSVTYYMDDGLYTGTNCFNIRFETKKTAVVLK